MFKTVIWMGSLAVYLLGVMPRLLYVRHLRKKGMTKEHTEATNKTVYKCADRFIRLCGVDLSVEGRGNIPENEAVIFTPNHQSIFDIPVMFVTLDKPHGMVSKIQADKIPAIRLWMRELHCVFMDRDNPRKALEALNAAADNLKNGFSMVIFPEGTRSKSGDIGEFKSGAFRMAKKSGAKIVPVLIDGTRLIYEANGNRIKPSGVTVKILEPIDYKSLSKEEKDNIDSLVRQRIIDAKSNYAALS